MNRCWRWVLILIVTCLAKCSHALTAIELMWTQLQYLYSIIDLFDVDFRRDFHLIQKRKPLTDLTKKLSELSAGDSTAQKDAKSKQKQVHQLVRNVTMIVLPLTYASVTILSIDIPLNTSCHRWHMRLLFFMAESLHIYSFYSFIHPSFVDI